MDNRNGTKATLEIAGAKHLPEEQREQLCRELLAEFGVTNIRRTPKKELIHSCPLPFGGHKNGDRNPSASLNFKKLAFNCLGCGSGGGLLWFVAACRGQEIEQARDWLLEQTGLGQTVMELPRLLELLDSLYHPQAEERVPIPTYSPSVLRPWTHEVFHPYLTEGVPELNFPGRGIPESTLKHFRVGYTENYFDDSERIIFPLFWQDKLVGWQARHIVADGHSDKYRNSPDFPRDRVFYNFPAGSRAVVVESPMSTLRHYHHERDMTAAFGAKLSDDQIGLLQRFDDVILWFDNDDAGWTATTHVGEALLRHVNVWAVQSPYAADPADFDDELVDRLTADAIPFAAWTPPRELIPWTGSEG